MSWHNYKGGVLSKVKSILTNFIPGRRGTCQEGAAPVLCVTRRSWKINIARIANAVQVIPVTAVSNGIAEVLI